MQSLGPSFDLLADRSALSPNGYNVLSSKLNPATGRIETTLQVMPEVPSGQVDVSLPKNQFVRFDKRTFSEFTENSQTGQAPTFTAFLQNSAGQKDGSLKINLNSSAEIGAGSGRNLPFYGPSAKQILALEPSPRLLELARGMRHQQIPITFLEASAEAIPLDDRTVDTVVTTWSLCTIPHAATALNEMRRVLRPGGRLRFVEHGLAPDESVRWWQDRLTPAWKTISGGCHLNRPIQALIEGAGFRVERIQTGYLPGPKPMTFMYEGSAGLG